MTITKALIEALIANYGPGTFHDHANQLAMDVERVQKVAATVARIAADERAIIAQHRHDLDVIRDRLRSARKDCPHPVSTPHHGPDGVSRYCDVCGEEL